MSTINNMEVITDFDNLYRAFRVSQTRRSYKQSAMYFRLDAVSELEKLQKELTTKTYKVSGYTTFDVSHPKQREIKACKFRDKVVQHVLCDNILSDELPKICITDNYAGQKGKGSKFARERLRNKIKEFYKLNGDSGYFFKGDISKYYYNINHEKAIDIMCSYFQEDIHWLIREFINSTEGKRGIALGNQVNTIVSNLYLDGFDKFVTHELGIQYYGRYADDFFLIHEDKEYLKYCIKRITEYLGILCLELNPKSQIIPFKNGINFLGFKFYPNGKIILENTKRREYLRKFNRLVKKVKQGELPLEKLEESYNSWRKGHASYVTDWSVFIYFDNKIKELKQ